MQEPNGGIVVLHIISPLPLPFRVCGGRQLHLVVAFFLYTYLHSYTV